MQHACIVGTTKSGKSFLAKRLCQEMKKAGRLVLVLDPIGDTWHATRIYSDKSKFLTAAQANKNALLVVDESTYSIGRGNDAKEMLWLPQRSRHWGHQCVFIMHKHTSVEPAVREMCDTLFLFKSSLKESEYWAEEFCDDTLKEAHTLEPHYFFKKMRNSPAKKVKI